MRLTSLQFCCISCPGDNARLSLRISHWHVGYFPMTMTVQECLEDFCERVGWEFVSHEGRICHRMRIFFDFRFRLPRYAAPEMDIVGYLREQEKIDDLIQYRSERV